MREVKKEKRENIPLPQDKVILLDLDKTLIDANYQITDPNIFDEITRVQGLGWQLGLHSDTPLPVLEQWAKNLGINGPIIAERGAIVKLSDEEVFTDESELFFQDLRRQLVQDLSDQKVPFVFGDVTKLIGENTKLPISIDDRLVLIQAYRKCSLSVYRKLIDSEGYMQNDEMGLIDTVGLIRDIIGAPPFRVNEDINPEYGIYILSPKRVNKRTGAQALMRSNGLSQIGMIGNGTTDYIGDDIAMHYAVGNADDGLKSSAVFISDKHITSGVVDILSNFT